MMGESELASLFFNFYFNEVFFLLLKLWPMTHGVYTVLSEKHTHTFEYIAYIVFNARKASNGVIFSTITKYCNFKNVLIY